MEDWDEKITKQVMAVGIAIALAATSVPTSTQLASAAAKKTTAKKKTSKKSKNTISLKVGGKKTLKVKGVAGKTKIKWKTSKKKVATVSKKGVVKAKKAGTTKITAKYGKKKTVWTVKVTKKAAKKVGVASIAVLDSKTIRVNLTAAKALKASNFVIRKKRDGAGQYTFPLQVGSVTKLSSKAYEISLALALDSGEDENVITDGDYVQVTVSALSATKSRQTQYFTSKNALPRYLQGKVGDSVNRTLSFTQSYTGYLTNMKITGVPNGLTAKKRGITFTLKGTYKTAKASVMTLTAKDEKGKNLVQKYNCYVGSDSVMFSYIDASKRTILANNGRAKNFDIYTVGGTGELTYSLPNNNNSFFYISYDYVVVSPYHYDYGTQKYNFLPAGNYKIAYRVQDEAGHVNNGTLAITAVNGVKVTGRVMALDNSGVADAEVHMSFVDRTNNYYTTDSYVFSASAGESSFYSTAKMKEGDYEMVVYPSQLYQFYARRNDTYVSTNSRHIGKSAITINYKLALYKVSLSCGSQDLSNVNWRENGDYVGNGKVVYLPKGIHTLTGTENFSDYKATFGVTSNRSVKLTQTESAKVAGTLKLDESISCQPDQFLKIEPTETGTYYINATVTSTESMAGLQLFRAENNSSYFTGTYNEHTDEATGQK